MRLSRQGRFDVVVYEDVLVFARSRGRKGGRQSLAALSPGQVADLHPKNRLVPFNHISDVDVWERPTGGQATLWTSNGSRQVFSWSKLSTRDVDVTALLTDAMPAKVDLAEPGAVVRVGRIALRVAGVVVVVVGLKLGLPVLLSSEPAPPPPPPAPRPLTPTQQAARSELDGACPAWTAFTASLAPGQRPDPAQLRPVVDGMRPRFDAAAASDPSVALAVSELGWLQHYARLSPDEVARESAARISFAVQRVSAACAGARK